MIPKSRPGVYIPTLYFAEGLPYTMVMMMSGVFFKNLGADNIFIGLTSFLYLPWILKFAWAPFVDAYKTKRQWIILMQFALAALAVVMAITTPLPGAIEFAVILLFALALASATQDVAIDGYYLDALKEEQQAFYVGVRNAAYKVAWLFGSGGLVFLAGLLQDSYGMSAGAGWSVAFAVCAVLFLTCAVFHKWYLPHVERRRNLTDPGGESAAHHDIAGRRCDERPSVDASGGNTEHGFDDRRIMAADRGGEALAKDALAARNSDTGPAGSSGPADESTRPGAARRNGMTLARFVDVFRTYFAQPGVVAVVLFILLFRLGDALLLKQAPNFLLDPANQGGLALSVADVGIINGTVGMIFLLVGGILGGWLIAVHGLKRWFWPMAIFMNAATPLYFLLAKFHPGIAWVYVVNSVEQFAYGIGTAAYTVFLLTTIRNEEYRAAHYAIATALMALGVMLPQMASGFIQTAVGYANFFLVCTAAAVPGILAIAFLPIWKEKAPDRPVEAAAAAKAVG